MGLAAALSPDPGGHLEVRGHLASTNGCSPLHGNHFLTAFSVLGTGLGFRQT